MGVNSMNANKSIRCRMVACREAEGDGKEWSFYLINDSDVQLESALLHGVGYEWGDMGNRELVDARIASLAPGANALLWRGNDEEMRMDLHLRVKIAGGREAELIFEFPKLYRKRDLPIVAGLGKPGWQETAEA